MQLKVVTINIWKGQLLDNLLEFLEGENPDLLFMQEVLNGTEASSPQDLRLFSLFKRQLKFSFAIFSSLFNDIRGNLKVPFGNAIFARMPLQKKGDYFYDIPFANLDTSKMREFSQVPRLLQWGTLDLGNGKVLNLFNNHGIWGTDGRDNPRRLNMAKIISQKISGKQNVILAGDFNMDQDTDAAKIIEKDLVSVFKGKLTSTFNLQRKDRLGFESAAVDMVFLSPNIKILKSSCPRVDISDHLPLAMEIEV